MKIEIQHSTRKSFSKRQKLVMNQFFANPLSRPPSIAAPVVAESRRATRRSRVVVCESGQAQACVEHAVSLQSKQQER